MSFFYFILIICCPTPSIAVCCATSHHVGEGSRRLVICDRSFVFATGVGAITMGMVIAVTAAWPFSGLTSSSSSLGMTTFSTSSTWGSTTITTGGVFAISLHLEAHGVYIRLHCGEKTHISVLGRCSDGHICWSFWH